MAKRKPESDVNVTAFEILNAVTGEEPCHASPNPAKKKAIPAAAGKKAKVIVSPGEPGKSDGNGSGSRRDFAMTVRIEINLPPNGTSETYDNIFKSIKANLLNE